VGGRRGYGVIAFLQQSPDEDVERLGGIQPEGHAPGIGGIEQLRKRLSALVHGNIGGKRRLVHAAAHTAERIDSLRHRLRDGWRLEHRRRRIIEIDHASPFPCTQSRP